MQDIVKPEAPQNDDVSNMVGRLLRDKGDALYVIRSPTFGAIKIGRSAAPHQRFSHIQVANPDQLVLERVLWMKCASQAERDLHLLFEPWKVRGEWFWLSDELERFLAVTAPGRSLVSQELWDSVLFAEGRFKIRRALQLHGLTSEQWNELGSTLYGDDEP